MVTSCADNQGSLGGHISRHKNLNQIWFEIRIMIVPKFLIGDIFSAGRHISLLPQEKSLWCIPPLPDLYHTILVLLQHRNKLLRIMLLHQRPVQALQF